jgi:hypothetical protein
MIEIALSVAFERCKLLSGSEYEEIFSIMGWQPGRVLTEQDVTDLQRMIAQHEDEAESAVEAYHQTRKQILSEIGGEELVKFSETLDEESFNKSLQKALARYYTERAAQSEKEKKEAN